MDISKEWELDTLKSSSIYPYIFDGQTSKPVLKSLRSTLLSNGSVSTVSETDWNQS